MPKKIVSSKKNKNESPRGGLREWMPLIQVLGAFIVIGLVLYFVITLPPGWPNNRRARPTAAGTPHTPQPVVTQPGPYSELDTNSVGFCANKFWPVLEGSVWTYDVNYKDAAGAETKWKENWLLLRVEKTAEYSYQFVVSVTRGDENMEVSYSCDSNGFYTTRENSSEPQLVIFPEQVMTKSGQSWNQGPLGVTVTGISPQKTPAGNFQTVGLNTFDGEKQENAYYAPSVGLVRRIVTGDAYGVLEMVLTSFAVAQ
jgi:hypothetical protein